MKIKRLLSLLLVITTIFVFNTNVFATDMNYMKENEQSFSFIDAEGKVNTIYVSSDRIGSAHVDYYIDGILVNTSDAVIDEPQKLTTNLNDNTGTIHITYTDMKTSTSQHFTEPISNYLTTEESINSINSSTNASYVHQGRINYKTYYDSFGDSYTEKLDVYQKHMDDTYTYKTINADTGTAASVIISAIAAALTIIFPGLAILSSEIFYAAAFSAGVSIVGGYVQGLISKRYYVKTTLYKVKAVDPVTSREQIYDGEQFRIALEGGGYSSDYYYDGYLPWNSNSVASRMFSDFWAYPFPGVSSFT